MSHGFPTFFQLPKVMISFESLNNINLFPTSTSFYSPAPQHYANHDPACQLCQTPIQPTQTSPQQLRSVIPFLLQQEFFYNICALSMNNISIKTTKILFYFLNFSIKYVAKFCFYDNNNNFNETQILAEFVNCY